MKVGDGGVDDSRVDATGMRVAIVVARFNEVVSQRLLSGALDALIRHGAAEEDIAVHWVPGSFELPFGEVARWGTALSTRVKSIRVVSRSTRATFTRTLSPRRKRLPERSPII